MHVHFLDGFAALLLALAPAQNGAPAPHPPLAFSEHVLPLLRRHCFQCHGGGKKKGGLSLETREGLVAGGDSGPVVDLGRPEESRLLALVSGADPDLVMPPKGDRLKKEEVSLLRLWIEQGAPYDTGTLSGSRAGVAPVLPRRVDVPAASGDLTNPIDRLLEPYLRERGLAFPPRADDRTFARRVSLDLAGVLPDPARVDSFAADASPGKDAALVAEILRDGDAYAEHWITFWNDLLRNDFAGTGFIDGGRKTITEWLYAALRDNLPYDRFVRELVDPPTPDSEGFAYGIRWRGRINASQVRELQFAQNTAQVFLGLNLKCASCHDSFVDSWKLADAYGLAAVVADAPLEMNRCDAPTGETAKAKFLFPEVGEIDASAPRAERQRELAALLTHERNGRLARTIVNRIWRQLMGRGLVEPVDVMDNAPFSADVLDYLASDLAANGYDLKRTIELVATSRAYRSRSVPAASEVATDPAFEGPEPKRMTAEVFVDAVWRLTGTAPEKPSIEIPPDGSGRWIWRDASAAKAAPAGERVGFLKRLELDTPPTFAQAVLTADNAYVLVVNGRYVVADTDWRTVETLDLLPYLAPGHNDLLVLADNLGADPNPAGFWFAARIETAAGRIGIASDSSWECTTNMPLTADPLIGMDGETGECRFFRLWSGPEDRPDDWRPAAILESFGGEEIRSRLFAALRSVSGGGTRPVRAAFTAADPLQLSLGRPNREQVVTTRPATLSTLQALDLTNGKVLAETLARGAANVRARAGGASPSIVDDLFARALARPATGAERAAALRLLGETPSAQSVEDLLWSVLMLPEFQTIR